MSAWKTVVAFVDKDVEDKRSRPIRQLWLPTRNWSLVALALMILSLPLAFLEGAVQVGYALIGSVLLAAILGVWLWRIALHHGKISEERGREHNG